MNIKIKKIFNSFPSKLETLDYLCKVNKNWDKKKIFERTGVNKKRVSVKNSSIKNLMHSISNKPEIKKELNNCELMILVTQTPHFTIPSNVHYFQKIFNIRHSTIAFDVNQGCSGYIYGLAISDSLMKKFNLKKAALITCDTYSKFISKNNRTCRTIFGDALTLTILEESKKKHFIDFALGSDASGFKNFILKSGEIEMNGGAMYNFTRQKVGLEVENLLKKNKLKVKNIKFFIFHQASRLILETIRNNLKISKKNFINNIINVGNTTSSSIPIALKEIIKKNKLKKNDILVFCGFGVGYSWGSCIYKY